MRTIIDMIAAVHDSTAADRISLALTLILIAEASLICVGLAP